MAVEVGDIPDAGAVVAVVAAVAMAMAAIVGRRRRNSGYFIRVVTFVQLIASLRDAAEFKSMYRLTYEEFTQLHGDARQVFGNTSSKRSRLLLPLCRW